MISITFKIWHIKFNYDWLLTGLEIALNANFLKNSKVNCMSIVFEFCY